MQYQYVACLCAFYTLYIYLEAPISDIFNELLVIVKEEKKKFIQKISIEVL